MSDLNRRIEGLDARYREMAPGDPDSIAVANELGRLLTVRFFAHGGTSADRDRAITLQEEALAGGVPASEVSLTCMGAGVLLVFRAMPVPLAADPNGLAVTMFTQTLLAGGFNDPARLADRERARVHLRRVIEREPADDPIHLHATTMLAMLDIGGGDWNAVINALPTLMTAASQIGPQQTAWVEALKASLQPHEDPDRTIAVFTDLINQLPSGHHLRPIVLAEMGALLGQAGNVGGLAGHLSGAPELLREALDTMADDDPLRGDTVRRLAGLLMSATAYSANPDDVERAVRLAEELAAESATLDPIAAGKDRFLRAMAYTLRGRLSGSAADLREAVGDLVAALDAVPPDDPLSPAIVGTLGALLNDRHLYHGALADHEVGQRYLERARAIVAEQGTDDIGRSFVMLAGLTSRAGYAAQQRDLAELDRVVPELQDSLDTVAADYPWRSRLDAVLGLARLSRGIMRRDLNELRAGIDLLGRSADELAVEMSGRPALLALGAVGQLLGGLLDGDHAALPLAADRLALALEGGPLPESDRVALTTLQAQVAAIRYQYENLPDELDSAIAGFERIRELVAAQTAHPLAGHLHSQLAAAYRARTALPGPDGRADEDRRRSVAMGAAALRAYGNDVLLQSGAAHALAAARNAAPFARRVAEWCLDDGRPDAAVEVLELGRGLALHAATVAATVPQLLRDAGHDALALEWTAAPDDAPPWPVEPGGTVSAAVNELTGVPSDLRLRVLDALRGSPAARWLLSTPTPEQIADAVRAVDADALVYLLPGEAERTGRLIVVPASGAVREVPAPALLTTADPVTAYLAAHDRRAARARQERDVVPFDGEQHHDVLGDVCDWAWPAVIDPLLDDLGPADPDAPHRLVLVPLEGLGYVPWHAARTVVDGQTRYACEVFALSYAASARQLTTVARRPALGLTGAATLVADPTGDLDGAVSEVAALHRHMYPDAVLFGPVEGAAGTGTPDEVLTVLNGGIDSTALLHLACHARTDATPDESRLLLANAALSVSRILTAAQNRAPDAPGGLVVLSACASDLTSAAYDEAMTLATAFLAAGAVSVVGSRWPVDDHFTAYLMVMFHHFRYAEGLSDRDALRAAQRWMLDRKRTMPPVVDGLDAVDPVSLAEPTAWAAFTHHGR